MKTIDTNNLKYEDIIDVRDLIERVEVLDPEYSDIKLDEAEAQELQTLTAILEDLKGYGGDEQWRGDWYPVTLIRESHFVDYVQEMLEDCGEIPANLPHYIHIDWEATARDVMVDYSTVTIDGVDYLYR